MTGDKLTGRDARRRDYTTGEAAKVLAEHGLTLSQRTLIRYCDQGAIECTRTPGGDRRIAPAALRRFVEQYSDSRG